MYLDRAGPGDDGDHLLAGWSDYHAIVMPSYYGFQLHENGQIRTLPSEKSSYQTDVLSKLGQDFIKQSAGSDEPFLLFIAPDAPHEPAIPARRHLGKFSRRKAPRSPSFNEADIRGQPGLSRTSPIPDARIAEIDERYRKTLRSLQAVDEMIRDLVSTLSGNDELADTYIFYLSDNGLHFGQHRIVWGKGTPYEESVRVPLIVRGPGVEAGRTLSRLITNADLLPTLLDLAGRKPPDNIDGRSFASLLGPDAESQPWRNAIPLESRHAVRNSGVPAFGAIRTERYKWIEYENGTRALYDLDNDPHELTNVAGGGNAAIGTALSKQLAAILACKGPGCRAAEDAPVPGDPGEAK
jgi:arylsulfatase A-like enzyme